MKGLRHHEKTSFLCILYKTPFCPTKKVRERGHHLVLELGSGLLDLLALLFQARPRFLAASDGGMGRPTPHRRVSWALSSPDKCGHLVRKLAGGIPAKGADGCLLLSMSPKMSTIGTKSSSLFRSTPGSTYRAKPTKGHLSLLPNLPGRILHFQLLGRWTVPKPPDVVPKPTWCHIRLPVGLRLQDAQKTAPKMNPGRPKLCQQLFGKKPGRSVHFCLT